MCLHGVLVRGIRQKQQNTGEGSVDPRLCLRRKSLQAFDYGVQTQQHNSHDAHNDTGGQPVPDHRHAHANAQHHVQKDPPPRLHQCDTLGQHTPFRQESHTNAQGKQDTTNRVCAQCDKVFLFHNRIPLKTIFSKAVSLLSMHILSGARIHGRLLFRFLQEGVFHLLMATHNGVRHLLIRIVTFLPMPPVSWSRPSSGRHPQVSPPHFYRRPLSFLPIF